MQDINKPSELITLPSEGAYYNKENKLSTGTLSLYLPTTKHEDILTSQALLSKGIVIDTFLESLIANKDVDYNSMLLADKNGLLIASRVLLYGPEYTFEVNCPYCGKKTKHTVDISEFDTTEFERENPISEDNANEFAFTLPKSGHDIKFKLLTVGDDKLIAQELKNNKKIHNHDVGMTTRLSFVITEINGETNRYKIYKILENELLSIDSKALRDKITHMSPGIESNFNFSCDHCGHEEVMSMPIGTDFFWPSAS